MLLAAAIAAWTCFGAPAGGRAWPLGSSFALLPATGAGAGASGPTPPEPALAAAGQHQRDGGRAADQGGGWVASAG